MGDFTLVVPKGWEYDLHSVRQVPLYHVSLVTDRTISHRSIPHIWAISNCIACRGLQSSYFLLLNDPSNERYLRYDRSWGHLFSSFEGFLSFSWPVVTVTDACTGRPHIVTRLASLDAFLKMIRTR